MVHELKYRVNKIKPQFFMARGPILTESDLSPDEKRLLQMFRALNERGQDLAIDGVISALTVSHSGYYAFGHPQRRRMESFENRKCRKWR